MILGSSTGMIMRSLDVYMMRHGYDDHSYIDGMNDASLTARGVEMAKVASEEYAKLLYETCSNTPGLYVSSKKRAIETAEILSEELDRHKIEHTLKIEPAFRELYQGDMRGLRGKTHQERVRALEIGWEIFDRERKQGNYNYKYGTPDLSNGEYSIFNDFIAPPYGESQREFATRTQQGLLNVLDESFTGDSTPFIVAHRGTVREILNVVSAHNSGSVDIPQDPSIEMAGWRYCEIFHATLLDPVFSVGALSRFLDERAA